MREQKRIEDERRRQEELERERQQREKEEADAVAIEDLLQLVYRSTVYVWFSYFYPISKCINFISYGGMVELPIADYPDDMRVVHL